MNTVIVKKFGGTSLTNLSRVAHLIKNDVEKGHKVVVVVSAVAGFTDQMIAQAQRVSNLNSQQELSEYDVLLSAGEQISCGLLAVALQSIGVNAKSWLAWQLPVVTNNFFSQSKIKEINIDHLQKSFSEGYTVAVIAGFQGIYNNRLTTFGRGGSDISAVALAVAFNVRKCEIFTDIDGIYTADPKVVTKARKLKFVSYDEMLEMSLSGAKILHNRSVQLAMKNNIQLQVFSTFKEAEGTTVLSSKDALEKHLITGITCSTNEALITLSDVNIHVLKNIVDANIKIDMIHGANFVIAKYDISRIKDLLDENINYTINNNVAKVSIIGIGVTSNVDVVRCILNVLEKKKIEMLAISMSELRISVVVDAEYAEILTKDLHTEYGLDLF
ncbi:MAG: aspartate kinase [Wolbachia endosymbiont of Tyrophagus putrescentiae]|nr:aspartate kinase [Wolbachia endosymbiont of Tyrophagus putrescentiae]